MVNLENPFGKVHSKMVAARLALISQLAKFTHDELTIVPETEEWSALEVAHHVYLADGEALEQIHLVQDEENPLLPAFSEVLPSRMHQAEPPVSLEAVMAGMAARREELFEYLSALPPENWERPFRHVDKGQLKFSQLANMFSEHDQIHARQLAELKLSITPVQP